MFTEPEIVGIRRVFGRPLSMIVTFAALLLLSGCAEKRVEVFPVSGKVTYKGQAPVGATVVLHAVNASHPADFAPTGTVNGDGTFEITSYDVGDGAPQGEYVATIEWYKYDAKLGGVGSNVLPKKYGGAKTSPIRVSVNTGPTSIKAVQLY